MILIIDGRSGSGKTELASLISEGSHAQVLHLDDLYPGWNGLAAASAQVPGIIQSGRWQRYDWATASLAEWHELSDADLIIEGCGALSRASRELCDFALWVEHPADARRVRALRREPDFASHWDAWARQEDEHIARENPRSLADAIVDGAKVSVGLAQWRAMLGL
jgi:uridine kinase